MNGTDVYLWSVNQSINIGLLKPIFIIGLLVSLTTYDLCSIITHRTVPYAQLINDFWSNHGFPLNLANDPSVTFHLKRGTVYPSN